MVRVKPYVTEDRTGTSKFDRPGIKILSTRLASCVTPAKSLDLSVFQIARRKAGIKIPLGAVVKIK